MDRYYTPLDIAQRLVRQLPDCAPTIVADFAAGEGALLRAARERWPNCYLVGTDINPVAIRSLRRNFEGIIAGKCDFLNSASENSSQALRAKRGNISLVLINPPFSCRGGSRHRVSVGDITISCSRAMAFLINSTKYLSREGRVVALLPASCLDSEKDANARRMLSREFVLEKFGGAAPYEFRGCSVEVAFVSVVRRPSICALSPIQLKQSNNDVSFVHIKVVRGKISMDLIPETKGRVKVPLIHTTDLRDGSIQKTNRSVISGRSIVSGPAILIPRVGRPDYRKIGWLDEGTTCAISDCIIAIEGPRVAIASLHDLMKINWDMIAKSYIGSCAKYMTLSNLKNALCLLIGEGANTISAKVLVSELAQVEQAA